MGIALSFYDNPSVRSTLGRVSDGGKPIAFQAWDRSRQLEYDGTVHFHNAVQTSLVDEIDKIDVCLVANGILNVKQRIE